MEYTYKTHGVCARSINVDIDEKSGEIRDVQFEGGCNGNLKGIGALVKGKKASEVADMLEGIQCAGRKTSCPDQLSRALRQITEQNKAQ